MRNIMMSEIIYEDTTAGHQRMTVAQKRLLFESRTFQDNGNSNNIQIKNGNGNNIQIQLKNTNNSCKPMIPPPKPRRTFEQDHYFSASGDDAQKVNRNDIQIQRQSKKLQNSFQREESRPKLIVCRPLLKSSDNDSDLDYRKTPVIGGNVAQRSKDINAKNENSTLKTPKRPKYFQLSHEYEQIFSVERRPPSSTLARNGVRQRSASLENIYSTPVPRSPLCLNSGPSTSGNYAVPQLYYCSSPVPGPMPPPRFKKKENSSSNRDFTTPLTSKTTTKLKLSVRNVISNTTGATASKSQQADPAVGSVSSKFYLNKFSDNNNNNNNNVSDPDDEDFIINKTNFKNNNNTDDDAASTCSSTRDNEVERRVQRARVVRRQTLIHYDQQETAFKSRKMPQLFELAVVVELRPNDQSNPLYSWKFIPVITYQYPPNVNVSMKTLLASLPFLCYPDVSRATPKFAKDYVDEMFVVTVTDQTGDRKFAYCCRYVPALHSSNFLVDQLRASPIRNHISASNSDDPLLPTLPQVLCILTPVQAVQFYTDLVKEGAIRAKMNRVALNEFLRLSFNRPLPPAGGRLLISGAGLVKDVAITNRASAFRAHGLGILMERMQIDHILLLFASLLSERRVLIVGDNVPVVAKIIQASTAMLAPFEWPHTLIPVVPDSYVQLCFSPTPYLIGVLRSNLHELKHLLVGQNSCEGDEEDYILIYDLDYGVLKDRDSNVSFVKNSVSASTDESYRFLPTKVARILKQNLKTLTNSSSANSGGNSTINGNNFATPSILDVKAAECFLLAFVELVGHYGEFIVTQQDGVPTFQKQNFIQYVSSKSHKMFLKWFVETGMFQVWMRKRLDLTTTPTSAGMTTNVGGSGNSTTNAANYAAINDVFDKKIAELKNNNTNVDLFGAVAKRMASFLKHKK